MNIAPEILNYVAKKEGFAEVILAPKASPVERRAGALMKIMDIILSPEDIRDTLVSLRSHTPVSLGPLGKEGFFSFGLPEVGRIRVSYITQRDSYVVSVVRVPYTIPPLESILSRREDVNKLLKFIKDANGVVLIVARAFVIHNLFAYSLLQEICSRQQGLIYALEKPITYLIKHDASIVIQREVGVDVDSFEDGLNDALFLQPDIVYISDITVRDTLRLIRKLSDVPMLTIVGITVPGVSALYRDDLKDTMRAVSGIIELDMEKGGKIELSLKEGGP
ncbi:MAG TPA: hypothetical protein EYP11_02815 [Aquificaceae bacterium]|nr:hypothetical protein [Aquificaceae bacterium]